MFKGARRNGIIPPPSGTYIGERMMNLLTFEAKRISPGVVVGSELTCMLKSKHPVTIQGDAKVSKEQIQQYYQLTVDGSKNGRVTAVLTRIPANSVRK